jgi:hypothetical protein
MRTCLYSRASPRVGAWLLVHFTILAFHLFSTHFLTTLRIRFVLPHPMVAHLSRYQCGHAIEDLGSHLLRCPCGGEHTTTHDTFWNIIVVIALESGAHV